MHSVCRSDDLHLLSVTDLQQMLNICHSFAELSDIFNHKTLCFKVGPLWSRSAPAMLLGNKNLQWVSSFKYLGINLLSSLTLNSDLNWAFSKARNSTLSNCSTAAVFVKLSLVKSYCLPLLTYCTGALDLPVVKVKVLGVCWNDCFRKLFGCKRYESVNEVQNICGKLSFDCIYELQWWKFLCAAHKLCDRLSSLYKLQSHLFK